MKNLIKFLVILMVPVLLFTNCKDDPADPVVSEYETLTQYMVQNDLDLSDMLAGWVLPATALNVDPVDFSVPDYYVLDLRSQEDFDIGHIKNAVRTTLVDVLDAAELANGKPILVVCYTGQTAARATAALRLMKKEAYTLKWGMSGWHDDLAGKWKANVGDFNSPNWLNTGEPKPNQEFNNPNLTTGEVDGAAILRERVRLMLQKQWTVSKEDVLGNPDNYFVNNYWPIASWNEYGHVKDAYRVSEDLGLAGLKYLDPNATIVTYCYTGQTSGIVTGWLDVLGYDGRSLMFGANGIVHSKLVGNTVGDGHKKSWHGEGAGSQCNFGYYDASGNLHGPI
jgi:rhodanese-related sulfurtransferase